MEVYKNWPLLYTKIIIWLIDECMVQGLDVVAPVLNRPLNRQLEQKKQPGGRPVFYTFSSPFDK